MRNKAMQLGAVLAAILLLSIAFISAVSAHTEVINTNNNKKIAEHYDDQSSEKEKGGINNSLTKKLSKKDQEKLEKIMTELDKKTKIETEESRKQKPVKDAIQIFLPDSNEVTLQSTTKFTSANDGDSYYKVYGLAQGGADYSINNRYAREALLGGVATSGNAWAWVGQWITVSGSSQTVNIDMSGYAQAYAEALGAGSAKTKVKMGLYDGTTGTEYDPVIIFDGSASGAWYEEIDRTFNVGNSYYLESGQCPRMDRIIYSI